MFKFSTKHILFSRPFVRERNLKVIPNAFLVEW